MRAIIFIILLAVLATLFLASCGGGDPEDQEDMKKTPIHVTQEGAK